MTDSRTRTPALAVASIASLVCVLLTGLLLTGLLITGTGCSGTRGPTSSGMLPARWTPPDAPSQPVPFSFEGEGTSTGLLFTTLGKGGEHFRGQYVLLEESTKDHLVTAVYDGWSTPEWNLWKKQPDGHWTATATTWGDFAHFYTGKVVAYLPGSNGHAMRCRITLTQPRVGFLKGGTGECQTTDGSEVDLEF